MRNVAYINHKTMGGKTGMNEMWPMRFDTTTKESFVQPDKEQWEQLKKLRSIVKNGGR